MALLLALASCGGQGGDRAETEGAASSAATSGPAMTAAEQTKLIRLWAEGTPAFGIFVPSERERGARGPDGERLPPLYTARGGAALAANPLLDYAFLNLESSYDADAVRAIAEGIGDADVTLLVRIPPISADGAEAARTRVAEILAAGGDGVVLPHVRGTAEAREAVSFFDGHDVWSPENPEGTVLAMLMIEDPGALEEAADIADVGGYSVLACGIGSLTQALGGDREAGEAGNQAVLVEATRAGLPDMITANAEDVAQRIDEGFLGLLMSGPEADRAIEVGRAHVGR
jgi:2-keto-3-deoxy-L-rhamnonate aldolase RhmA